MVTAGLGIWALALAALLAGQPQERAGDRLYGRVVTHAGDVYTGFVRWDRNEGSWTDLLDGFKKLPDSNFQEAARLREEKGEHRPERTIEFMGVRISWDDDEEEDALTRSAVRFGHLSRLTVLGDASALLLLRSGEEVEFKRSSTDIGEYLRGLVVDDGKGGEVELAWSDLDRVEFLVAPAGAAPSTSRLHGTLRDRWGNTYTGYVAWDLDEIFGDDLLDGEVDGEDKRIPFDSVASIERAGSRAARVTLLSGEELTLVGSNDVNSDNRGIQVSDPMLGQVQVPWAEFEDLHFHAPESPTGYDGFAESRRLRGTVLTEDGEEYQGFIRWDNDEAFTWEMLDGEYKNVAFQIELDLVERIRRRSSRSAMVTLRDGRTFELSDSDDVNSGNRGILVETAQGTVLVEWQDLREVTFQGP